MIAPAHRVESSSTLLTSGHSGPAGPFVPVLIAADHCKGCALCVGACAKGSLAIDESVVNSLGYHPVRLVSVGSCTSCALCARVCPDCVLTILAPPREPALRQPRRAAAEGAVPVTPPRAGRQR